MLDRLSTWFKKLKAERKAALYLVKHAEGVKHGHVHDHIDGIVHMHQHGHGEYEQDHTHDGKTDAEALDGTCA